MGKSILAILASPRFLAGVALLGVVVLLCMTACGPGADRTQKKAEPPTIPDFAALLKERDGAVAGHVSESVVAVVTERDRLRVQVRGLLQRLDRIEARLKKLENPPPTYRADPSWNVYVGPIEDVPHYAPCGEGQSSNIVDAKTGKPLCRVDANKGGKPHDGEVRSSGRCDETAGQEIYSATLGQWVCMNAPKPTAPWPGDKAPEPTDHVRGMSGEKGGKQ